MPPGAICPDSLRRLLIDISAWLGLEHKRLDAAVFAPYGWPANLADEEILERLLALNLAHTGSIPRPRVGVWHRVLH